MSDYNDLIASLNRGVVTVKFTKEDGSIRVMRCTLVDELMPPPDPDKKRKSISRSTVVVWDLDKVAWRSFNYESVIEWHDGGANTERN